MEHLLPTGRVKEIVRIESYAEMARSIQAQHRGSHWRLWAVTVLLALTLTIFAANGVYLPGDVSLATAVQRAHGVDLFGPLSDGLYQFGAIPAFPAFGLIAAGIVARAYRRPVAGAFILVAMLMRPFGAVIKELVERPRPTDSLVPYVEGASGFSFPSGHVFGTVLLVGFVCYVLIERDRDPRKRFAFALCGVLVSLLMGAQRVYAGAHWPSDVLAGYLWGGVVLFLLIQAYRTMAHMLEWRTAGVDQVSDRPPVARIRVLD